MSLSGLLKTFREEKVVVKEGKKYVEKDTGGISLKGVLQRGRLKLRKEKTPYAQGVGFRPSGITYKFCRRAKIGQLAGVVNVYDSPPTPKLQSVFDVGHAIHDQYQGYFWDIGLLRGDFFCLKCDKLYPDLLAPTQCPVYKTHTRRVLEYREVQARNEEYLIRGRCDGILDIDGEQHVFDIKSIANRTITTPEMQFCFEDLDKQGPKDYHIVQLMLYMWMLVIHKGHLFYVAKNNHQVKSFAIPYDESIIRPYLDEIAFLITTAKELQSGAQVELPDCCDDETCPCASVLSKLTG